LADAAATAAALRLDDSNIVLVKGVSALSGKRSFPASKRHTIASFCAVIEHSQIMVAQPHCPTQTLPAGFNYTDIAVLDWIAAEGRRQARSHFQRRQAGSA
jgi:hypothetical protein